MFNRRKPEDTAPLPPETPAGAAPQLPTEVANIVNDPRAEDRPAGEADNGLDVPPYRPATFKPAFKETPMARTPFSPPPLPPAPPSSLSSSSPRPSFQPATEEAGERRTLVVGRGISVQGTVQDAERLVVEGTMEAGVIAGLTELSISQGGIFKGEVEVDEAEVAGTIDGTLTARNALVVRATGRVLGTAKCRRLQVEDGGQITGRIEMLTGT